MCPGYTLGPAIHVFAWCTEDVDARHKAGHDAIRQVLDPTRSPLMPTSLISFASAHGTGHPLDPLANVPIQRTST
jgi:hypothetical protein